MKSISTLFFLLLSMSGVAEAGILIEPYLGYESGTLKQSGNADITNKGTIYGARLGYQMLGLKFGLDYMTGSQTAEQSGTSSNFTPTDIGAFVGYKLPIMFQAYASYFFSTTGKFDSTVLTESFTGSGYRLGVGYTGLPVVAINLELISRTYSKYGSTDLTSNLASSSMALTVSAALP